MKSRTDTMFFWDGIRRIDMVLAFVDEEQDFEEDHEQMAAEAEDEEDEAGGAILTKAQKRANFERSLVEQGLELELEPAKQSADKRTNFLKISAPWHILARYAEILNLKKPIKVRKSLFPAV